MWIDFIVGPADHLYSLLDLDECGEAMAAGHLCLADAADGLARAWGPWING